MRCIAEIGESQIVQELYNQFVGKSERNIIRSARIFPSDRPSGIISEIELKDDNRLHDFQKYF